MHAVALNAITSLPMIRITSSRKCLLNAFLNILSHVPSVALRPQPWIRLAVGLLPQATIAALRARRRNRWAPA